MDGANTEYVTRVLDYVEYGGCRINRSALMSALEELAQTFGRLLDFEGPSGTVRGAIQSAQPIDTDFGQVTLSRRDVEWVIQLSNDLNLSEVNVIHYLAEAHEKGSMSTEAASGLYFAERIGICMCLHRILSMHAFNEGNGDRAHELISDLQNYNCSVLGALVDGKSRVFTRLVELIKNATGEISKGEDQQVRQEQLVLDARDRLRPRWELWAEERNVLCEMLLLAVKIKPRMPVANILELMDLREQLVQKTLEGGATEGNHVVNGLLVLFSVLMAFLPQETAYASEAHADEHALEELAKNAQLTQKMEVEPSLDDYFGWIVRLAWSVLRARFRRPNTNARESLKNCSKAGVFRALHCIMSNEVLKDCTLEIHSICAEVAHSLVLHFLEVENKNIMGKAHLVFKNSVSRMSAHWANLPVTDEQGDHLCNVLDCLAEIYEVKPSLVVPQRPEPVLELIGWVPDSGFLSQSPEVFCSYLNLLSAMSTGEEGAAAMYDQFVMAQRGSFHEQCEGFKYLQWSYVFKTLLEFCMDVSDKSPAELGKPVSEDDCLGLMAYLKLIRKVFSEGPLESVVGWIQDIEHDFQDPLRKQTFQDVLIFLLCQPIPHECKAAINRALLAFCRTSYQARNLLTGLSNCTVLRFNNRQHRDGQNRYDLLYQFNQIEAGKEDYPETLAYVRLTNTMMKNGFPVPNQAMVVADVTTFVCEAILPRLHTLKFQSVTQLWELMGACLDHLYLCLDNADFNPTAVAAIDFENSPKLPPGYTVMQDVLCGGNVLETVVKLLAQSVEELQCTRMNKPKTMGQKFSAIHSALKLLRTVFQYDMQFVEGSQKQAALKGYDTFDNVLLRLNRENLFSIFEYIHLPDGNIQVEVINIMGTLSARIHHLVEILVAGGYHSELVRLVQGMSNALGQGLFEPRAVENLEGSVPEESSDLRARSILKILLDNLPKPGVNIGHLLCGFNVFGGIESIKNTQLHSKTTNCFAVVLHAALSEDLPIWKPQLHEACLEVICALCRNKETIPATLAPLKDSKYTMLLEMFPYALDLTMDVGTARRAPNMFKKAFYLEILATGLLFLQPHVGHQDGGLVNLVVAQLFGSFAGEDPALGRRTAVEVPMLSVLERMLVDMRAPELSTFISLESADFLREFGGQDNPLDLVQRNLELQSGDVQFHSRLGGVLFDCDLIKKKLSAWFNEQKRKCSIAGGPDTSIVRQLAEIVERVYQYAAAQNAYIKLQYSAMMAFSSWRAVLEVCLFRHWNVICTVCQDNGDITPHGLLVALAALCIQVIKSCGQVLNGQLCMPLCQALQSIIRKLSEECMEKGTEIADYLSVPSTPNLFGELLETVIQSKGVIIEGARVPLISCMYLILSMSRLYGQPNVHSALGKRTANTVKEHTHALIQCLSTEIADRQADTVQRLVSFYVVKEVVALDGTVGIVKDVLLHTSIFQNFFATLSDMVKTWADPVTPKTLQYEIHAGLSLFLQMTMIGGGGVSSQRIANLLAKNSIVEHISSSRLFRYLPQEWPPKSDQELQLCAKMHPLISTALKIVDGVLLALSDSRAVREQVQNVVETHIAGFRSVLIRAQSRSWDVWRPSNPDIECATLVICILSNIDMQSLPPNLGTVLHDAVCRVCQEFCCLTRNSRSPFVNGIRSAAVSEILMSGNGQNLWRLRESLMLYFNRLVFDFAPVPGMERERDVIDIPTPLPLKECVEQSLCDAETLLEERENVYQKRHTLAMKADIVQYLAVLDDGLCTVLRTAQIGLTSLVGWFKRGYRDIAGQENRQGNQGMTGQLVLGDMSMQELAQLILRDVDGVVKRVGESVRQIGFDTSSFVGVDELEVAWQRLEDYVAADIPNA